MTVTVHVATGYPATTIAQVVREAYPDRTAFDKKNDHYDADSDRKAPRWFMVDVQLVRKFDTVTGGSGGLNLFDSPNLTGAIFNVVHVPGGRTLTFNDWLYYLTWLVAVLTSQVPSSITPTCFGISSAGSARTIRAS